ncbi:MAG: TadE/TadG family type IV pilus assembly protein [Pseudomonadota bacterium]
MLKSFVKRVRVYRALTSAKDEKGGALVEFAFVAPLFLAIVLAIIEFSGITFAQTLLEGGAGQASRFGILGSVPDGSSREQAIRDIIEKNAFGVIDADDVRLETLTYNSFAAIGQAEPFEDANGNGSFDENEIFQDINGNGARDDDQGRAGAGDAGQVVLYRLTYDWDIMVPIFQPFFGEQITLQATTAVRNEPAGS